MVSYLYIVVLTALFSYDIIRSIYLFNKGQYNPYIIGKEKKKSPFIIRLAISLGFCMVVYGGITSIKLLSIMTVIFLCYSVCLLICVSVLNYLSYMRIKNPKIMFQTAVFDIIIIIISTGIWKFFIHP